MEDGCDSFLEISALLVTPDTSCQKMLSAEEGGFGR